MPQTEDTHIIKCVTYSMEYYTNLIYSADVHSVKSIHFNNKYYTGIGGKASTQHVFYAV